MKTMSLQAPSDVRRSRKKAKQYIDTHEQMFVEVYDKPFATYLDVVLSRTDFSEVNHAHSS